MPRSFSWSPNGVAFVPTIHLVNVLIKSVFILSTICASSDGSAGLWATKEYAADKAGDVLLGDFPASGGTVQIEAIRAGLIGSEWLQ
jgi:hypothetical protein